MTEGHRPRLLIEDWLPVAELGIESVRERAVSMDLPPLFALHVWWARRPLVASAGAILASLLPAWSPELADSFDNREELSDAGSYRHWFLRLCGIWGDPIAADLLVRVAKATGNSIPNPYTYKQAYKNSLDAHDLGLLHEVLERTWGRVPTVLDPTAGGGSIPCVAARLRLPSHANDLNPVAASVLRATVEIPARFGVKLAADLERWGSLLVERLHSRLSRLFPSLPDEMTATYIFARAVTCPRTGKCVPLVGDWALRRGSKPVSVRLVTERSGDVLDEPEFEILEGAAARFDTKKAGTWSRGKGISPWDHLVIDSDYIKAEAQAGRMGDVLYAVATRTAKGRGFRVPTEVDLHALERAEAELARLLPQWERDNVLPAEAIPAGNKTNEPHNYGMPRWRDMFTPRQLLVHGMFVEEYRDLIGELRESFTDDPGRADAVLALLAMMHGKALNWNARMASWDVSRQKIRSIFDSHNFAFKHAFAEFEGGTELFEWCLRRGVLRAYAGLATLVHAVAGEGILADVGAPAPTVTITSENAGNLTSIPDESQTLVCIDPPYYDNVMYAELADYFYVWHKRTLGRLWPDLFEAQLTNKDDEAVTNKARFAHAGRRAKALADHDYTAKMAAIFAECRRVLAPDGVMTVMFTHKRADAWDSLGTALLQAGFEVRASWPVHTESEQSLHQARQNAVKSTVFLSCRKRADKSARGDTVYLDDIAVDIRSAAGDALERGHTQGLVGVDLLLSTYGPALSVLSSRWPVYAAEADETTGRSRLLRPEEALAVARTEVLRRERMRLVGREIEFDPLTDFTLLAWSMFGAREFPYDEARKLALSISDLDLDDVVHAKLLAIKSGLAGLTEPRLRLRRDTDAHLPGIDRSRTVIDVWVDAVHTAAYITAQDGVGAAKRWLDERDLTENPVFESCLQAFVRALPNTKHQGEWNVPEAGHLHSLVRTYFDDIELPPEPVELETEDLSLPGIADD